MRNAPGPGPPMCGSWPLMMITAVTTGSEECAIIRCLGPGDCQHPSPVARLTNGLTHGITIFPWLSITSIIDNSMAWPGPVLSPFVCRLDIPSRGMRWPLQRESQDQIPGSDFIKISLDPVPTLQTLHLSADNFIRQLKFYRGNVIPVSDDLWLEMLAHFSSSQGVTDLGVTPWHHDTCVTTGAGVTRPHLCWLLLTMALLSTAHHKQTHADTKMEQATDSHDQSIETFWNIDMLGFCLSELSEQRICNKWTLLENIFIGPYTPRQWESP